MSPAWHQLRNWGKDGREQVSLQNLGSAHPKPIHTPTAHAVRGTVPRAVQTLLGDCSRFETTGHGGEGKTPWELTARNIALLPGAGGLRLGRALW